MPRGPKPTPDREFLPEREPIEPPSWILPSAVPYFHRLATLPGLEQVHAIALADWAQCWARLHEIEQRLEKEGLVVCGYRGSPVKNPLASVASDYRRSIFWYVRKFRASPKYRNRRS